MKHHVCHECRSRIPCSTETGEFVLNLIALLGFMAVLIFAVVQLL